MLVQFIRDGWGFSMRRTMVLLVGVVVGGVGAACGGGSSSSSSSTTTTTSTTSTSQAAATAAADRALAQQINLQQSDFPAGWQSQPPSQSGSGNAGTRQLLSCIGVSPSLATTTTSVDSPDFSQSQSAVQLSASSNVGFAVTTAQATGAFQALSSPKASSCVQNLLASALKKQNVPGLSPFQITSAPVAVPSGDQGLSFTGTATATVQGQSLPLQFQTILVLRGRAEITLLTGGVGTTFPPSLQQSLLSAMTTRANQVPA